MKTRKFMTWEDPNYDLVAMDMLLAFVFRHPLGIVPRDLELSGGVLRPGDTIHGMFGPMTSAQYMSFHPVAPECLVYQGTFRDLWREIVVCRRPDHETTEDGRTLKYGWILPGLAGEGCLFSLLRCAGTIRTIQTDILFLNGNMPPPECIGDDYYWKRWFKKQKGK